MIDHWQEQSVFQLWVHNKKKKIIEAKMYHYNDIMCKDCGPSTRGRRRLLAKKCTITMTSCITVDPKQEEEEGY
jgi:hypothetical protein